MTSEQYNRLSTDLRSLASRIPLNWGSIQNNKTDSQINMFQIDSYESLEQQISSLSDDSKNYLRRRWFLWKCSQCDEHLFCQNMNVNPNPNHFDQSYDIQFNLNASLRFDVKGTVIPYSLRTNVNSLFTNPTPMIKFFYDEQSKGVRNNTQNRLFIVHHSFISQNREMYLRCVWDYKKRVFDEYSSKISTSANFIKYQGVIADVIFILEDASGNISHKFFSI